LDLLPLLGILSATNPGFRTQQFEQVVVARVALRKIHSLRPEVGVRETFEDSWRGDGQGTLDVCKVKSFHAVQTALIGAWPAAGIDGADCERLPD